MDTTTPQTAPRRRRKEKTLTPISIRFQPDLKSTLQQLADADDRSLSAYIQRALRRHVEQLTETPDEG